MWPQIVMASLLALTFLLGLIEAVNKSSHREWIVATSSVALTAGILWKGGFWAVLGWPA